MNIHALSANVLCLSSAIPQLGTIEPQFMPVMILGIKRTRGIINNNHAQPFYRAWRGFN